ncbi:Pre-mRNA-splicing factor spp2 [Termitomyces sp. J132]|nr:hypothetical protein H2248_004950 [Termitomyces sp. 'cryptogamus']KNZ71362.1 Pre-mRNA-splicing factor spp2 [Termitomyces sp. J132]
MAEKVSFTIRRPTPVSRAPSSGPDSDAPHYKLPSLPRHLSNGHASSPAVRSSTSSPIPSSRGARFTPHEPDSSDEDDDVKDELVTGFDRFGVRRLEKDKSAPAAPLVIPALKNRDWRDLARRRKTKAQYVPPSAKAETGEDGTVGGLGTKDTINSGPVLSGLQLKKESTPVEQEEELLAIAPQQDVKMEVEEDDEDKVALRAILAGVDGTAHEGPIIDIIPTPVSEAEAYKQDVEELPESATLDDYARVPVSQFGAALLRGMGWKEGTAATRKPGKGMVEPYLPEARPALLGIGAKEQEVYDDGSKKKGASRPEKKYVPLIKKEREGRPSSAPQDLERRRGRSHSPQSRGGGSAAVSRRGSWSRERSSDQDGQGTKMSDRRERDYKRDGRERDRDRDYRRDDRERDRDRDYRRDDRERDRDREYKREDRRLRDDNDKERRRERSRDSNRRRRD